MDNNLLTARNNNFSIASLITSDCCNDENHFYHSMTNPIEPNLPFHNCSTDKITSDYYPNSIQQELPQVVENEQSQQPIKKRENRVKTNLQKQSSTKGQMEGKLYH